MARQTPLSSCLKSQVERYILFNYFPLQPQFKLLKDLPGHADEVYGVDWSPDGQRVASGGKDRALRLWRK